MPVYNTKEEFLREAIESILNQTFSDFEFIIVNDGSTNNAEEVILSYKDDRIVYIMLQITALKEPMENTLQEWIRMMFHYPIDLKNKLNF